MAEVKGKFIILVASLMKVYKDHIKKADDFIYSGTGKHWNELDPEGWYDTKFYKNFMDCYIEASVSKEKALVTLGKNIYPTIKRTTGFPPGLETPEDFIRFEADGYLANLRGPEIKPRNITKKGDRHIIVKMNMKEQPCKTMEGIYLGMLEMTGNKHGKVEHKRCILKGDPECEFHITW